MGTGKIAAGPDSKRTRQPQVAPLWHSVESRWSPTHIIRWSESASQDLAGASSEPRSSLIAESGRGGANGLIQGGPSGARSSVIGGGPCRTRRGVVRGGLSGAGGGDGIGATLSGCSDQRAAAGPK